MRSPRFALGLVLAVLSPALFGGRFDPFHNYWGNVIVNTDMTPAGEAISPPTRSQPVYYRGLSLGPKLGTIGGDEIPDTKRVNGIVAEILAREGYIGARPGVNEPSLFLVVQWGYLDSHKGDNLMWFLGYNRNNDIGASVMPGMLGPEVFRTDFRSTTVQTILDNVRDPNYGIIITAFDYKSARTDDPVVLWQSRIALPANGKSMAEALPTMLVAAGPSIGRNAKEPVLHDADSARAGTVRLGELEFLEDLDTPPPVRKRQN